MVRYPIRHRVPPQLDGLLAVTALGTLETLFRTVSREHENCAECAKCDEAARIEARVTGSTGGTYLVSGNLYEHGATVERVPLMPVIVPLVSLKARVIGDIRHAEEDVPLIAGNYLTDAGIEYLNSLILDPECERNEPRDFYRKAWRLGLTTSPPRE